MWAEIAAFWSTNHAVRAADQQGRAAAERAQMLISAGWRPSRRCRGAAFRSPTAPAEIARRAGETRLGAGGDLRAVRERRHARPPGLRGAGTTIVTVCEPSTAKSLRDRFGHLAGLRGGGQHVRVGRGQLQAQGRQAITISSSAGAERDGARPAHDRAREPVPGAALGRSRRRAALRCRRAGASALMRGPERDEHGRQHDQRDRTGRQRHERPTDPHRVEEAHAGTRASRRARRRPSASCTAPCAPRSAACA